MKKLLHKKTLYVILLIIATVILALDLAAHTVSSKLPTAGNMPVTGSQQMQMPDTSNQAETSDSADQAEMPDGSDQTQMPDAGQMTPPTGDGSDSSDFDSSNLPQSSDGNMPTPPGGTSDSTDSGSTTEDSSTSGTDMPSMPNGTTQNSTGVFGILMFLSKAFLPILIICIAVDALCILMLIRIRKMKPEVSEDALPDHSSEDGAKQQASRHENSRGKKKKHKRAKWIVLIAVVLIIILIVTSLAQIGKAVVSGSEVEEKLYTEQVETGSIESTLSGSGSLAEEDAVDVTIPGDVTITSYSVSNGDTVEAGDEIAKVDKTSAMSAIVNLQDTLDALDEEISETEEESVSTKITASVDGRVKAIFAEKGTAVLDTMYEHSALMLISLDGLMSVSFETDADVSVGDSVTVVLSDGSTEEGRVAEDLKGQVKVTLTDDGTIYGDSVTVKNDSGDTLGTGNLEINSELQVTGFLGTTSAISVSVNDEVTEGETLMTLTDTDYSSKVEALYGQRTTLQEQMSRLFTIYQNGAVYAESAGQISGISEDSTTAEDTAATGDYTLALLSTEAPSAGDGTQTVAAQVTKISYGKLTVKASADLYTGTDYTDLAGQVNTDNLTQEQSLTLSSSTQVYCYQDGSWEAADADSIESGDLLIFNTSNDGTNVTVNWIICEHQTESEDSDSGNTGEQEQKENKDSGNTSEESNAGQNTDIAGQDADIAGQNTDIAANAGGADLSGSTSGLPSGLSDYSSMLNGSSDLSALAGLAGTASSGDSTADATEEEDVTYGVDETSVCSITPQENMILDVSIDELDILNLSVGDTAEVTLDALKGQQFEGTVTHISKNGTSEGTGGDAKYQVEITLERTDDMLSGMNASAKVSLGTTDNVLVIPEAALYEDGSKTYVYTGYDEKDDTLTDPVEVTTGVSDGTNVEITDGLSEGDTYYYKYADSISYNFSN